MLKRCLDIAASAVGLIVLALPMCLIAIAVRLSSPGPALFRQVRVGQAGEDFTIYKFRTMAICDEHHANMFAAGDRTRVTPLGGLLRATKLDEFPQLWNVLRGDMSLVGPRPEVRKWVDAYPERWRVIHRVRPGITDPASIIYRNEEELLAGSTDPERVYREVILPKKLDLYEQYVNSHSFGGDIGIIFRTFKALVPGGKR